MHAEIIQIAKSHHQAGRLAEAEQIYRQVLAADAANFEALYLLGVLNHQSGQPQRGIELVQQALHLHPAHPLAAFAANNLGNFQREQGALDAAIACYRQAVELKADFAIAHYSLALAYREQQHFAAASASLASAVASDPGFADAHYQLAVLQQVQGQLEAALASYRRALALDPKLPRICFNLGVLLQDLGRLDEAAASYRRFLADQPEDAAAHYNLGVLYQAQGLAEQALASYQHVLAVQPTHADAQFNRGVVLHDQWRLEEAAAAYRLALAARPGFVEALYNLGNVYKDQEQADEALACYRQALALNPSHDKALLNQGVVLRSQGRLAEAIACYRQAIALNPDYDGGYSNLLFCLAHDETAAPAELLAEHRKFGQRFDRPLAQQLPPPSKPADARRRLRIGLVSGDLRSHPVALYLEPILAALDGEQLEVWAYANHPQPDDTSRRLQGMVHRWQQIDGVGDLQVAEGIRRDGIDILIDLSGHTSHHRLQVFTYKPAPLQATWIGYFGTTGLAAIDYLLADPYLAPAGVTEALVTEQIVRLPAVACFQAPLQAPPLNALPALATGILTFASFNRVSKLGAGVIARWSRLLQAVPHSRLLLGAIPNDTVQAALTARFAEHGIDRARLQFLPNLSFADYLAIHQQVDLLLDSYPFAGGATSNYAAWMGVPILTLAGPGMLSRQGAALMQHLGLADFVAESEDEFVALAVAWAGRLPELARIRSEMRKRCLHSPIHQPQRVAQSLERALRTMWQRWCAGLPAAGFSVADV